MWHDSDARQPHAPPVSLTPHVTPHAMPLVHAPCETPAMSESGKFLDRWDKVLKLKRAGAEQVLLDVEVCPSV